MSLQNNNYYCLNALNKLNQLYESFGHNIVTNSEFLNLLKVKEFLYVLSLEIRDNTDVNLIPIYNQIYNIISDIYKDNCSDNVVNIALANISLSYLIDYNLLPKEHLDIAVDALYSSFKHLNSVVVGSLDLTLQFAYKAAMERWWAIATTYIVNTNNAYPDLDSVSALISIKDNPDLIQFLLELLRKA